MTLWIYPGRLACVALFIITLTSCFQPPYNHFREYRQSAKNSAETGPRALFSNHKKLIKGLQKNDIQFVKYGDTNTLIVPTDNYFYFDSAKLNDLAYCGLNQIVTLLQYYPCTPIYVAGFTDDVGSREHKQKLSQARAEAMLTFLWAKGIAAQRLHPEGYADKHPVGDNKRIRGSAYNRRLEIQWLSAPGKPPQKMAFISKTK